MNSTRRDMFARWGLCAVLGVAGGGSGGALLPKIHPELYRPDPATGKELRATSAEVRTVAQDLKLLETQLARIEEHALGAGARRVTENQMRLEAKLDAIIVEVRRLQDDRPYR